MLENRRKNVEEVGVSYGIVFRVVVALEIAAEVCKFPPLNLQSYRFNERLCCSVVPLCCDFGKQGLAILREEVGCFPHKVRLLFRSFLWCLKFFNELRCLDFTLLIFFKVLQNSRYLQKVILAEPRSYFIEPFVLIILRNRFKLDFVPTTESHQIVKTQGWNCIQLPLTHLDSVC